MTSGTLVDRLETTVDAASDTFKDRALKMRGIMGDKAFNSVDLDSEETARRYLPVWFVLGQAEDPVAVPFWTHVVEKYGPKEAVDFDKTMRRLHHRYWEFTSTEAGPELGQVYLQLRANGLHGGKPREPLMPAERGKQHAS